MATKVEKDDESSSKNILEKTISLVPEVEPELPEFDKAPDGGFRAWLVAAAGSATFFCLGITWSFGVFQHYYAVHQLKGESPDRIAWIGSVAACIQFAAGAITGPLFDRFGSSITRPAAVGMVFSLMMLSLCNQYWQFILVQGFLVGICSSMLQLPAFAATSQYFDKHRATALGIAVAGSSLGGAVFPLVASKMLNDTSLGYGWSIRVLGFMIIPFATVSCFGLKPRLPPRKSTFFILSAWRDRKYNFLVAGFSLMFLGMNMPLYFIPTFAVSKGVDPALASYFVAIMNAATTFGRVIPGILADKFGRFNIFALGGISTGLACLFFSQVETTAGFIVFSIAFGFTSGSIVSGGSAALTICSKDPRDFGTYMGMASSVASVFVLVGAPINGALVTRYGGGFLEPSIFSGIACIAGGLLALVSKTSMPGGLFGRS